MNMDHGRTQYQLIRMALCDQIEHGGLKAGSKLPSERMLSERFGTTRVTLREALASLEADGLVYREDRRGWFVAPQRLVYDPTRNANFHTMVTDQGRSPATRLLSASLVPATAGVQRLLGLQPLTPVYRLQRLRSVDNRVVVYVENYIIPEYFPGLLEHNLERSLSDVYREHYSTSYHRVRFQLYPVGLHGDSAHHLKVTTGSSGLLVTRVNQNSEGLVIDCDFEYWRHDAIVITAETG
ncbi:UTRA domain-containing protein [Endozoicomonas atrinae]|uniref:UTRA domain-containing protein n=1 Tax=Endozoicomonas atrinae TaxID=1333660 RepID=UPI0009F62EF6|nr:UTRA domain-containing protein [Endozoicomonas atrinae]